MWVSCVGGWDHVLTLQVSHPNPVLDVSVVRYAESCFFSFLDSVYLRDGGWVKTKGTRCARLFIPHHVSFHSCTTAGVRYVYHPFSSTLFLYCDRPPPFCPCSVVLEPVIFEPTFFACPRIFNVLSRCTRCLPVLNGQMRMPFPEWGRIPGDRIRFAHGAHASAGTGVTV